MLRGSPKLFCSRWGLCSPALWSRALTVCSTPPPSPMSPPLSPRSAICSGFSPCAIAGANASSEKMNSVLAAPRRISDLLSSVPGPNVKRRKRAMDQPRTDEDQQLVARTQDGEAGAFDQLVVKYTPRLYGLVYNMTSNHEDTNDLLQDIFSKSYKSIRGFRGKSSFYTWIHSIAV